MRFCVILMAILGTALWATDGQPAGNVVRGKLAVHEGQPAQVQTADSRQILTMFTHISSHTPASVARYAALITRLSWTVSAHAKDIWMLPLWEKRTAC